jgi:hypothetical protein
MPRRRIPPTRLDPASDAPSAPEPSPPAEARLSDEQVRRWAALIADGRGEFPADLSPPDRDRLLGELRQQLRARLVHLIARAVAQKLHREAGPSQEDSTRA